MSDDLDALLREHYRAAADGIRPDPAAVRRFQDAGRAAAPARAVRRWTLPTLAAAVTAAVLVAVAVLVWPGVREPEPPRPMAPPVSPVSPASPEPRTVPPEPWTGPPVPSPSSPVPGMGAVPEPSRPGGAPSASPPSSVQTPSPTGPAPTASPTPGAGYRPAG
ncbi:hypothetical protein SAMN05443665_1012138 [Actinomadura meyerae]|uniref:Uncharacterized protein n=1 Tax=Actinomadura meyerae TaxID=240840 RepID=A0A239IL09_9ACTN|nr:hypothetical protein [Actinomadura meyerae]SNS93094.1 hypothetical protein SAMN05443665_1012138 [Actinomadura meyerae]